MADAVPVGKIGFRLGSGCVLVGGALSRIGLTEYLYLSEFLGAVLMFIGFFAGSRVLLHPHGPLSQDVEDT